jgi:hypothetical protein
MVIAHPYTYEFVRTIPIVDGFECIAQSVASFLLIYSIRVAKKVYSPD